MTIITKLTKQADIWGILASGLCLLHCLATPLFVGLHVNFILVDKKYPLGWGSLDVFFLMISFLAIMKSAFHTSKPWMSYALWFNWGILTSLILNERLSLMPIREEIIYLPTIALIVLHLYNLKYCQCKKENCCANT